MRRRWQTVKLGVGALTIAGLTLWWVGHAWLERRQAAQQRERGGALFRGEASVSARLMGHDQPLPVVAVRCTNCHEAQIPPPAKVEAASRAAEPALPFGGVLNAASLTTLRARRGGPPSDYGAASFCALLRTGVDPAKVIISNIMPRYDISPADCQALWAYLSHRTGGT